MSNLNKKNIISLEKTISNGLKLLKDEGVIKSNYFEDIETYPTEQDGDFKRINDDSTYKTNLMSDYVSFVELAIINSHLFDCYKNYKTNGITVKSYSRVDPSGVISFGGGFSPSGGWVFNCLIDDVENNEFSVQTKIHIDNRNAIVCMLSLSSKVGMIEDDMLKNMEKLKKISFNNSEYKGKCIKVRLYDGYFNGIEVIDVSESTDNLILNETQELFINQFIKSLKKGNQMRYLLDGEPGCGKTSSIRYIIKNLIPQYTFIIPDFSTVDDLTTILEACEIFDNSVVIMDDIDLFLGSRDNGSYTRLLGQFLSFFDGVKKRKISLLASTNDKKLVDKAAERPGRFNLTLDFGYLNDEQLDVVCKLYIQEMFLTERFMSAINEKIDNVKPKLTGAFISNFGQLLNEMSECDSDWNEGKTITLFKQVYKGFYNSQISNEKERIGFK